MPRIFLTFELQFECCFQHFGKDFGHLDAEYLWRHSYQFWRWYLLYLVSYQQGIRTPPETQKNSWLISKAICSFILDLDQCHLRLTRVTISGVWRSALPTRLKPHCSVGEFLRKFTTTSCGLPMDSYHQPPPNNATPRFQLNLDENNARLQLYSRFFPGLKAQQVSHSTPSGINSGSVMMLPLPCSL